ncbi:MAG: DNA mismatch repair endonuclease MutL, partial [Alphaproteobacteria bacterium]|nr:DNA mismatch repair endonuclease MutL [Alphaproteobacteria bacterium]
MIDEKTLPKIKALSTVTINRIAAGEVVERPSAVVKELVENSLDAGATEITVKIESGGKNLILVSDNGCGMSKEDLELSVERHTTSKLSNDNLIDIKYFGFRGEALPSIASVSRMTIKTCTGLDEGWELSVIGGEKQKIQPIAPKKGTIIEIRDLFFATPARLKFLRSEKTENQHIIDLLKKISAANPKVRFSLFTDQKLALDCPVTELINPLHNRVSQIFNKNFIENTIEVSKNHQDMSLKGYISLPTYNKGNANDYYIYVNNRPVKDKLILASIRVAYHDFLSRDRYPVTVLFLDINSELVDVNVHPSKTEVRFRDPQTVRSFIIHSLKEALQNEGGRTSSTIAQDVLNTIQTEETNIRPSKFQYQPKPSSFQSSPRSLGSQQSLNDLVQNFNKPTVRSFEETKIPEEEKDYPLGAARCQLHETYIISQTPESIVIVDQHAAHERLMYEKLKEQTENNGIEKQRLLIPEI